MRALWFALALFTVSGAQAADDPKPLTKEERVAHAVCIERGERHVAQLEDRYHKAIVSGFLKVHKEHLAENRSAYKPEFRGDCNKLWDRTIAKFNGVRVSDHEFEVAQRQEEMRRIEDTREKLVAMSTHHETITGSGYRIDVYTIDGVTEHCKVQVFSQGPIMKCSRWPD
jgi:hypothetical protein